MRFTLTIDTDNAAFHDFCSEGVINEIELANVVAKAAGKIRMGPLDLRVGDAFSVQDSNGNRCAEFKRTK